MKHYDVERTGQMDFFDNYGIDYINEPVLIDNTDGIYKGHILEFKLSISNLSKVLLQAIKYLSAMRIRGESVPATILLIDLNRCVNAVIIGINRNNLLLLNIQSIFWATNY